MSLQSLRIRNFKAVVDSKTVKLGALTAFIGNNGAGKSSLIEALETYQAIVRDGLDLAMQRWLGIEHVRHKAQEAKERAMRFHELAGFKREMTTAKTAQVGPIKIEEVRLQRTLNG